MDVLVVEDSGKLQAALGSGLRTFGYSVDTVDNARQAIEYADVKDYDIIILDLMLPKESSLQVLHEIRESNREVEILILSSQDQIHDRVTALIQGANDYLVKPFSLAELHARIQELVMRKVNLAHDGGHDEEFIETSGHLNRLIENLLRHCNCNQGEIELVLSEIKLVDLLYHACTGLEKKAARKSIGFELPRNKMPTLFVDVHWMQHLLANLINNAILISPIGAKIGISFEQKNEYCQIEIANPLSSPLTSAELRKMFEDFHGRRSGDDQSLPVANLSLARRYADCMNLGLHARLGTKNKFEVQISRIKTV